MIRLHCKNALQIFGQFSALARTGRLRLASCGLMEIEHLIRYTEPAVGLKPSARQGKARLRGLYRIIYSKTISLRLWNAKPACAGYGGLCTQRPSDASLLVSSVFKTEGERLPIRALHLPPRSRVLSTNCVRTQTGISACLTYTSMTTGKTIGRRRVCP